MYHQTGVGGDWMMMMNMPTNPHEWTRDEDKIFEQALVEFPDEIPDRWQRIAALLPGRSPEDVVAHYETLLYDIGEIEAGRVEPPYTDELWEARTPSQISFDRSNQAQRERSSDASERKKGTPWTEDEHKLFLKGLEKYGKGDWRSISRNVVVTRTPTQVASHAQKYFLRHSSGKKERKRSSIHDITSPMDSVTVPAPTNLPSEGGFSRFGYPTPR